MLAQVLFKSVGLYIKMRKTMVKVHQISLRSILIKARYERKMTILLFFSLLREWVELGDVIYKQQRTMIADTKIKVIDILCRKLYEDLISLRRYIKFG